MTVALLYGIIFDDLRENDAPSVLPPRARGLLRWLARFTLRLVLLGAMALPTAEAACLPGYGMCSDGTCAPLGSVCCGNGRYCGAGNICTNSGMQCLSRSSDRVCPDGSYCNPGHHCVDGNRCAPDIPPGAVDCGGGRYCDAGNICINNGSQCLSRTSERVCSDGTYCNPGHHCVAGDRCVADLPAGAVDCGGGHYCEAGNICVNGGSQCLSRMSDRVCSNGTNYCNPGFRCTADDRCVSETAGGGGGGRNAGPPGGESDDDIVAACTAKAEAKYDASLGQNLAFMEAGCLDYCASQASNGSAKQQLYQLYLDNQQRAYNMCSIGAPQPCNVIDTQYCRLP